MPLLAVSSPLPDCFPCDLSPTSALGVERCACIRRYDSDWSGQNLCIHKLLMGTWGASPMQHAMDSSRRLWMEEIMELTTSGEMGSCFSCYRTLFSVIISTILLLGYTSSLTEPYGLLLPFYLIQLVIWGVLRGMPSRHDTSVAQYLQARRDQVIERVRIFDKVQSVRLFDMAATDSVVFEEKVSHRRNMEFNVFADKSIFVWYTRWLVDIFEVLCYVLMPMLYMFEYVDLGKLLNTQTRDDCT